MVNSKNSEISNNIIIKASDTIYFESIFSFKSRIPSNPSCTPSPSASHISSSSSALTSDLEPRRSKRIMTLTFFGEEFFTYLIDGDPRFFKKAMTLLNFLSEKKPLIIRSSP